MLYRGVCVVTPATDLPADTASSEWQWVVAAQFLPVTKLAGLSCLCLPVPAGLTCWRGPLLCGTFQQHHVHCGCATPCACLQVLLAVESNVVSVDADAAQQVATMSSPIRGLAVSPNGQFVATLPQDGQLQVGPRSKCK